MIKLILLSLVIPSLLVAGNIFKSKGDPEWLMQALDLENIAGFEILESEVSSVISHKYWSYKLKVTTPSDVFENLNFNLNEMQQLTIEGDLINVKKVLPISLREPKAVLHTRKEFAPNHSDILLITLDSEKSKPDFIVYIVFIGEPLSLSTK